METLSSFIYLMYGDICLNWLILWVWIWLKFAVELHPDGAFNCGIARSDFKMQFQREMDPRSEGPGYEKSIQDAVIGSAFLIVGRVMWLYFARSGHEFTASKLSNTTSRRALARLVA